MVDALIIKSLRSAAVLKLSDPKPPHPSRAVEYFQVTLKDRPFVESSSRVFVHQPYDLAAFFDDLAAHWTGWEGERQWSSVEGDLKLVCTSDQQGLVSLNVTLRSGPYLDDWTVQADIYIDAGQLKEIADKIKSFLHVQ